MDEGAEGLRPNSENVSAIIVNPQGTLPKFNRMGVIAKFGDPRVRMIRSGFKRTEGQGPVPAPVQFQQDVNAEGYSESWIEGMTVLHNPSAVNPLDPELLLGAAHEFLQDDGRILSMLPDFQPMFSGTRVFLENDEPPAQATPDDE